MRRTSERFGGIAAAAALLLSLAACGGGTDGGSAGDGTADPNGVLNVGYTIAAPPMDPHKAPSDVAQFSYSSLVYDRLTRIEPGLKLAPMLAESWEFAADGMAVDFKLRAGVTFSDGAALDAAAVKASLDRAFKDPESTVAPKFTMVDSVEAVDASTVRIRTNRKAADLPYLLAGTGASIISPKALQNPDLDVKPVGSGPYVLTDLKLGEAATFQRRDGYWNPDDAKVETIKIVGLTDDNARLNALRSGQVDLIASKLGQANLTSKLGSGFDFYSYPAGATYALLLNTGNEPLDDPKVRQALNYAVDRPAINEGLLNGYCAPGVQPLTAGTRGYLKNPAAPYGRDLAKAKRLLAEAGHPDGFEMDILIGSGLQPQTEITTALQAQLAEVGVKADIREVDPGQFATLYSQDDYDSLMTTRLGSATPISTLSTNFLNKRYFPGPVPAELTESIAAASDPTAPEADVTAALEKFSSVANEQALDVFICDLPTQIAYNDKVVGAKDMGVAYYTGVLDLRAVSVTKD
ncbi:peptide/nickel transport system substrate-binding protein [Actinocorallia herbida]|uniref:Peptide/nickel transport system substrate-binding protein n=1 Tax=Actinocorallia herbida TaxID=58109 RepID=A0A3N1D333_9ACTN|nr:ABC transporter substrate-binding protein [Actinocorallia herbida]ROO87468.1 peptide/nickel transport system substrate-binding protein [Actinocorallia herbida]